MMKRALILLLVLQLVALPLFSANHYITASGLVGNTGNDWSSPWPISKLTSTTPVRGDTYFVASGSYGSVTLNKADSTTSVITVKKATVADHGTATGWLDAMAAGQVTFSALTVSTDYWTIDGNQCASGQSHVLSDVRGVKVDNSASFTLFPINFSTAVNHINLFCMEVQGYGQFTNLGETYPIATYARSTNVATITFNVNSYLVGRWSVGQRISVNLVAPDDTTFNCTSSNTGNPGCVIISVNNSTRTITYASTGADVVAKAPSNTPNCNGLVGGNTTCVFGAISSFEEGLRIVTAGSHDIVGRYLWMHDTGGQHIITRGIVAGDSALDGSGMLIDQSLVERNSSNPAQHSNCWTGSGDVDIQFQNSYWRDIEGTGCFTVLTGTSGATTTNLLANGNVIAWTSGNPYHMTSIGNGVFNCINNQICTNARFVNNSTGNMPSQSLATAAASAGFQNTASGTMTIQNNYWWNNGGTVAISVASGTVTEGYNTSRCAAGNTSCSGATNQLTGTNDEKNLSTVDPFNGDASNPMDYTLVSNTTAGLVAAATTAGNDMSGTVRAVPNRGSLESLAATPPFTLNVACLGASNGTIQDSPQVNINCTCTAGVASGTCTHNYNSGTVTLHAAATTGSFTGWAGDCLGTSDCVVTLGQPVATETATFSLTPSISAFSASPSTINILGATSLTWTTSNASACSIDNGIGTVDPNSTASVSPVRTTTYTLSCSNAAGNSTSTATVTVTGFYSGIGSGIGIR